MSTKTPVVTKKENPAGTSDEVQRTTLLPELDSSYFRIEVSGVYNFNDENPVDYYTLQLILNEEFYMFDDEFELALVASGADDATEYLHSVAPGLRVANGEVVLAQAHVAVVHNNEDNALSIAEVLDEAGGDYLSYLPLFDADGDWAHDLDEVLEGFCDDLLIVESVRVAPAWRGRQLGAFLVACAVERLGQACRAAACFPAPLGGAAQQGTPAHKRAMKKLTQHWESVGFTPWKEGISLLDPALQHQYTRLVSEAGKMQTK